MQIIAIVGPSGSGKTTLADFLGKAFGLPVVCSYTTRPMREGEVEGREHHYVGVEDMPPKEDMLSYTFFGGHHYWTTRDQLVNNAIYVIDEDGLRMLWDHGYRVIAIYIDRDVSAIDKKRTDRDKGRKTLSPMSYDLYYSNDGTLEKMLFRVARYINEILSATHP